MKIQLLLILSLLSFTILELKAHPSYGIVVTESGELIFCDVLHNEGTIWKLDRQQNLSKILTGEHCHFIFKDQHGQIWGTDHDYIEARDLNRNSLWKLVGGEKQIVIQPTEDPTLFSGVNFAVDPNGKVYYNANRQLYVRHPDGTRQLVTPHKFGRIMSLQMALDGQLLVVDNYAENGALIKVSPQGDLTYLARGLIEPDPSDPPFEEPRFNLLYAAFAAANGSVFVANSGSRRITRVDPGGAMTHIYHSKAPWYPVAYTEHAGIGYVMEMSFLPGIGNLGPQIQRLDENGTAVLVNIDADKMPKAEVKGAIRQEEPASEKSAAGIFSWIWYLLGGLPVVLLLAFFARKFTQ